MEGVAAVRSNTRELVSKRKRYLGSSANGHISLRKAVREGLRNTRGASGPVSLEPDSTKRVNAFVDKNGNPCEASVLFSRSNKKKESILERRNSELLKDPRYRIVKEIKDSERSYLTFIQSVVMLFYQPCKQTLATSNPILEPTLFEELFGNIIEIAELSSQLLQAFELIGHPKRWEESTTLGDVFFELLSGDLPVAYLEYVSGYGKRLKALANTTDQFNLFRKEQEGSQLCGNHTLSSLLITPIQRIPRYILLLRDLKRHTPPDHEDSTLLPEVIKEFEALADKLDQSKKKADTRDQFADLLAGLIKKCDEKTARIIRTQDIEAAGEIVELIHGEFVPLFCFLFDTMLIACVVKKGAVTKVQWIIDLKCSHLVTQKRTVPEATKHRFHITDNYILITELRPLNREPFSESFTCNLFPGKPPYDMGFWYNSILSVVTSLWFDKKMLLHNSDRFKRHIEKHLFPKSQWKLIQLAGTEETHKTSAVLLEEGKLNEDFCMIKSGKVKIVKPLGSRSVTLGRLYTDDFFGEFSYFQGTQSRSAASIIAEETTVLCRVSFDTLTNLLLSDPGMMYRFFRFQCCVMANRLVLQLFTRINCKEVQKKRKDSRNLQFELIRMISLDNVCEEGSEISEGHVESELEQADEPSSKETSEDSQELYIPHQSEMIFSPRGNRQDTLTKKYASQLAKHVPHSEQVLAEYNVILTYHNKSDQKGKFLFLDHFVCLSYRKGFSTKLVAINHNDITQVLENENQHMLIIIVPSSNTPEIRCIFDTHSDYCTTNSLLQNLKKNQVTIKKKLDFFTGIAFSEQEWDYFMSLMRIELVPKGTRLIKLGTTTHTVYKVVEGEFMIKTTLDSGAEHPVVGPGSIFGDLTFLQGGISSADIIAESELCEVICFDKEVIDELSQTNPLLVGKFYRMLAAEMVSRFLDVQSGLIT